MKILIVDDNPMIIEGLLIRIDWRRLGFEPPLTAKSASEAGKVLSSNRVDLMLLDIEMPGESGLEFWDSVRFVYPKLKCVFLTSHAEFKYVQKAIHDGGFDYVLQPARQEEIEKVVSRCREVILEEQKSDEMKEKGKAYDEISAVALRRLTRALFQEGENFAQLQEWLAECRTSQDNASYVPVILQLYGSGEENRERRIRGLLSDITGEKARITEYLSVTRIDSERYGIIFYYPTSLEYENWCKQLHERIGIEWNENCAVYIAHPATETLASVIQKLKNMSMDNVRSHTGVHYLDNAVPKAFQALPDLSKWVSWLNAGDGILVINQIKNLIRNEEYNGSLNYEYMSLLYHHFVEAMSVCCNGNHTHFPDLFDNTFPLSQFEKSIVHADSFCSSVERVLNRLEEQKKQEKPELTPEDRIGEIVRYIESHLSEPLTRQELSAMFFMNEDYMSRCFKNVMGMGLKEYVIQCRMEFAKTLLSQTNFPISVISSKAGYDNFSNFSQAFRKYTGTSPGDYRKEESYLK